MQVNVACMLVGFCSDGEFFLVPSTAFASCQSCLILVASRIWPLEETPTKALDSPFSPVANLLQHTRKVMPVRFMVMPCFSKKSRKLPAPSAQRRTLKHSSSDLQALACQLCRRQSMEPISRAGGPKGCRVIAVDRPPFGLSQRPLQWDTTKSNPYTTEVPEQKQICASIMRITLTAATTVLLEWGLNG